MNRAKLFAEKVGIAVKTAKNIIDLLYKKGLDAKAFDRVMWKLERLVRETQLAKIMDQQTDDTINGIIDEMILQDSRCQDMPCEAYSERMWYFTDISEMFGEGENQKVLKAGDEVTIQIMRAGQRNHPLYGKIAVDKKVLKDVKKNFDENVR